MLRSARLTLKQHRFEVGAGALAMILVGAAALWVNTRMQGVLVPAGCLEAWMAAGPFEIGPECEGPVREFLTINEEEAGKVFAAMAVLPIAAGLLAGVTLVGRELESRTAQTAWGLAASRRRWFGRQLWPVLLVLGVTVTFAAIAASILEASRPAFSSYVWRDHGLYGPLVVARAFAALGVGLLAGAAIGRTLPAFIVGAVLSLVLVMMADNARYPWAVAQPRVIVEQAALNDPRGFDGITFQQAWRAPDGTVIVEDEAHALAPQDGSVDSYDWLLGQGYEVVQLGITAETARRWEPLEIAGTVLAGFVLVLGTVVVVDRRRPT